METAELARRLGNAQVQAKLKRAICKFPSEWNRDTAGVRYGFAEELMAFADDPQAFPRLQAHLRALSFAGLPAGYLAADWRMHPREFINIFRRCLWLSLHEMRQLVPMKAVRGVSGGLRGPFYYERIGLHGGRLLANHHLPLNLTFRKFGVVTRERLAAFVGNSVQETSWWATTEEGGGPGLRYAPWYGRGFLQLTNPNGAFSAGSNYGKYFLFRGRTVAGATAAQLSAWREAVALDRFDAADSAGAYWSWSRANAEADTVSANTRRTIQLHARSQLLPGGALTIYENVQFRRVACLINLPGAVNSANPQLNGLVDRYSGYDNAQVVLFDTATFPNAQGQPELLPEQFEARRP